MSMKDLNSKFLSLLRYVPYLVDEKPKVQWFLNCLPYHIKYRIEYDNPKTLEEAMRKANFCYEQNRKKESMANWKAKKNNNYDQKKKESVLGILKIVMPEIFLIRISTGIRIIHRTIRIFKKIKSMLIITIIMQRTLNKRTRKVLGMQWSTLCLSLSQSKKDCQ